MFLALFVLPSKFKEERSIFRKTFERPYRDLTETWTRMMKIEGSRKDDGQFQ